MRHHRLHLASPLTLSRNSRQHQHHLPRHSHAAPRSSATPPAPPPEDQKPAQLLPHPHEISRSRAGTAHPPASGGSGSSTWPATPVVPVKQARSPHRLCSPQHRSAQRSPKDDRSPTLVPEANIAQHLGYIKWVAPPLQRICSRTPTQMGSAPPGLAPSRIGSALKESAQTSTANPPLRTAEEPATANSAGTRTEFPTIPSRMLLMSNTAFIFHAPAQLRRSSSHRRLPRFAPL